jgi:hypothetical protein
VEEINKVSEQKIEMTSNGVHGVKPMFGLGLVTMKE